ncbi:MAG TPA: hypothetical protein PKG52_09195 [bacterium]|nr:hypothetical protein [bacterium]HPS31270.1 hypothetical protein [bacterium]
MWRRAQNSAQKIAVLDGMLPITADEFLKAVIFFCGDDDEAVWKKATDKLRNYSDAEIRKNINSEISEKSVMALTKLAGDRKDAALIITILNTGKLQPDWVLTYVSLTDENFWQTLITHKDFVIFMLPKREDFIKFFMSFSAVLADLFNEQLQYLSEEKIAEVAPEMMEEKIAEETETLPFGGDEDVVVLGDENFDFPDFLISEDAFTGLTTDDMMERRKNIVQTLKDLTIGQKIKIAMMGNLEVRKILIKDPRKQIALAVLNNPRITEKEVASVAGEAAAPIDIISFIAGTKTLCKSYQVKLALVTNPKTPVKTALALLDVIRLNDLKRIAKSRNIPNVIKMKALKKVL